MTARARRRRMLAVAASICGLGTVAFAAEPKQQSYEEQKQLEILFEAARKYFPAETRDVAPRRIFRLTRDQIDVTVQSLLPKYYTTSIKSVMPRDPLQTNYEYAELLTVNAANFGALTGWIADIAKRVRKDPAGVIDCTPKAPADCARTAARRFIAKAFRGDVDAEAEAAILAEFDKSVSASGLATAAGDLVEFVLNTPDFLFRRELAVERGQRLAPAQLLQALTYIMADAPPEALGLDSADAPALVSADRDVLLKRIATSKPAREKMLRFFHAWLELKEPSDFTISPVVYPDFTPKLATAMVEETSRFLRAKLAGDAPSLKDITQTTDAFVSAAIEPLYGVKAADANGAKPTKVDATQRLGIFSQPAVIASHSGPDGTRPIKRGTFWLRKVMCMEMQPPPSTGVNSDLPKPGAFPTERKRIEAVTNQPACAGCHNLIDPLGFFQESYDALGRFRMTEGGGAPIDPAILINFIDEGKARPKTAVEALKTLTDSVMFKQCFVRQMFRFYMGRQETDGDDTMLRRLFLGFAERDNIVELVQSFAASDRIARRK